MSDLLKACERLRDDLLLRGEQDADGTIIVNASASVWSAFNDAIDEARWISVEDRLPDAEGMYLTYWPDGTIETYQYNGSSNDVGWDTPLANCGVVTHWMPLPEPPTGGEL